MSELWFYRMFGEEFGPVPLESLQELVAVGTIHAEDSVRSSNSGTWVSASSVPALGFAAGSAPVAVATSPTPSSVNVVADDWYCRIMSEEFGPLTFEELVRFAEHEHLGADDQVKLGRDGKWRRAGSIGRLMAVLPYVEPAAPSRAEAPKNAPATAEPAPKPERTVSPLDAIKAEADAAYRQAEEKAQAQLAWAGAPNVDRQWWYWMGGVETGPVDLNRIVSLAYAGKLQPTDYVRNGQFSQYIPSSNVPGLYAAIQILQTASQTRRQVIAEAQAAVAAAAAAARPATPAVAAIPAAPATAKPAPVATAAAAPAPAAPAPAAARAKSDPAITAPAAATPVTPPVAATKSVPEPDREPISRPEPMPMMSSGFGSSSPAAAPRPVTPPRPVRQRDPILPKIMEMFKGPQAQGIAAVVLVVALYFGWNFLPKSRGTDIKHYTTLKTLLDEIRAKRSGSPGELASLAPKLEQAGKEIAAYMKDRANRDDFAKQCLLWAARDEVPKMLAAGLDKESPSELNFETRLKEASYEMGLAKRPPVSFSQAQASTTPSSPAVD